MLYSAKDYKELSKKGAGAKPAKPVVEDKKDK